MKSHFIQISIISLVFFIPSALIMSGFFYYTTGTFQEQIYELDDEFGVLAEDLLNLNEEVYQPEIQAAEVFSDASFVDEDFLDYVDSTPDENLTEDEWELYEELLDQVEEEAYQSALGSLLPALYILLFFVFGLSIVAAFLIVRPLRRALEKQKQFIADASHEIKTPLALMQSELDLFEKEHTQSDPSKEQWHVFTKNMRSDVARLSNLVERLLHLARLDGKTLKPQIETCSVEKINTILDQLVARFGAQYTEHPFDLTQVNSQTTTRVSCERFEQLAEILLENACLHTPAGSEVTIKTVVQDGQFVCTIGDNGPGIARHHQAHIFERFYRVDESRNKVGNGLGLSIAKELVEQDGGTISVSSSEKGTTFTVTYKTTA